MVQYNTILYTNDSITAADRQAPEQRKPRISPYFFLVKLIVIWLGRHTTTLKRKFRYFNELFVTGWTESYQINKFHLSQWWNFHLNDNISVSVNRPHMVLLVFHRKITPCKYYEEIDPSQKDEGRTECSRLVTTRMVKIGNQKNFENDNALYLVGTLTAGDLMMTSSNGNIFRVTGHLWGEFTGPRWIPRTKVSDAELWCFLWSASE